MKILPPDDRIQSMVFPISKGQHAGRIPYAALAGIPATLAVWLLTIHPETLPASGVVQCLLATSVFVLHWNVLTRGLCDLILELRTTQDATCAGASLAGAAVAFLVAAADFAGLLTDGRLEASAGALLGASTSILVARSVGTALITRFGRTDGTAAPRRSTPTPSRTRAWQRPESVVLAGCAVLAVLFLALRGSLHIESVTLVLMALTTAVSTEAQGWIEARAQAHASNGRLTDVKHVILRSAGLVTRNRPEVAAVVPFAASTDEDGLLHLALIAEFGVQDPMRDALLRRLESGDRTVAQMKNARHVPGRGVAGIYRGKELIFGNLAFLRESGWSVERTQPLEEKARAHWDQGEKVQFVCHGDEVLGAIAFRDPVRNDTRDALSRLRATGCRIAIANADATALADVQAKTVGAERTLRVPDRLDSTALSNLLGTGESFVWIERLEDEDGTRLRLHLSKTGSSDSVETRTIVGDDLGVVATEVETIRLDQRRIRRLSMVTRCAFVGTIVVTSGLLFPICGLAASPGGAAWGSQGLAALVAWRLRQWRH